MKKTDSKRLATLILLALSIIVIFCQSFFYFQKKTGFYLDETLSFQLANNNLTSFSQIKEAIDNDNFEEYATELRVKILGTNTWKNHDEVMAKYYVGDNDRFHYLNTYLLQASDVHPPLYYFTIKTICSAFPNMDLKIVGYVINIICLMLTLLFVYKISMLVFNNRLTTIAVLLYYGLSYDFINNVTYFRMYAMLTFWMLCSVYLNLQWFRSGFENDRKILVKLCIVLYCSMLTQYFALFFCLPIFALNMFLMVKNKKPFGRYLKYCIITGVIYLLTWPASVYHILFSNRGGDVTGKLSSFRLIRNVLGYRHTVVASIFASSNKYMIGFAFLLVAFIAYRLIAKYKNEELRTWLATERAGILLYLFGSAGLYFFIAANSAPWFADRYIMPVMPLFSIIIIYIFNELLALIIKNRNICAAILMVFSVAVCLRWHVKTEPSYLYNSSDRLEYLKTCTEYDAVIIDKDNEVCNCEVEFNFPHPNVFETDDNNCSAIYSNIDKRDSYTFYINKAADVDEIVNTLRASRYDLQKIDYESDFYEIYKMNWR